ncbi:MAG: NADH-quinone oxidoreductase subunit L [Methylobacteriaceae bacterium]|nr:NADH-quinone oxidoreductase subunit L [Methylobacteriaceae bacterium]
MSALAWFALLGPLALVAVAGLKLDRTPPRRMADLAFAAALGSLAIALLLAVAIAANGRLTTPTLGAAGIGLGIYLDAISGTMFALVSFIGAVVVRYSRNYLDGDPRHGEFLRWLSVTLACVITLAIAGNLGLFIAAWVATSLSLHRLLLFFGERPAAQLAAKKKFIVSRIGDLCLLGAAAILFAQFGRLDFAGLFDGFARVGAAGGAPLQLGIAAALVAVAALLKSAQFPTHGWILEVMETPTPVSALLHAGIVNAGGFLVLRLSGLMTLSGSSLEILAIVGGLTALFGSVVMLTQTSIKVSLAYSTVAQMGFMMLECGLGAFSAALLHIVAHSLYKAHAFLSSGSVIDLARASWTPSPGGQPHPARLVLALVAVLGVAAGVAWAAGATVTMKPGAFVLGAILAMGLVHLLASAIDERPNGYVIGRAALLALVVTGAYFALQAGAERLTAGALPATAPLAGPLDLAIVVLAIGAFGAVTVFQSQMARHAGEPRWQALYVHLANGLYVNTLANRWVLRLWPRRATLAA